jgi:hypothetical protein
MTEVSTDSDRVKALLKNAIGRHMVYAGTDLGLFTIRKLVNSGVFYEGVKDSHAGLAYVHHHLCEDEVPLTRVWADPRAAGANAKIAVQKIKSDGFDYTRHKDIILNGMKMEMKMQMQTSQEKVDYNVPVILEIDVKNYIDNIALTYPPAREMTRSRDLVITKPIYKNDIKIAILGNDELQKFYEAINRMPRKELKLLEDLWIFRADMISN